MLFSSLINGFLQIFALFGVIPFINLIVEKNNFYNTNLGIFVKNNIGFFDVNNLLLLSAVFLILIVLFKNFYSWFHVGLVAKFIAKIEVRMRNNTLDKVIHSRFEWINNYNSNYLREVVFNYAGAWGSQFVKSLLILKNELLILFFILGTLIYMDPASAVTLIILSALVGMTIIFIVKNKLYFLEEKKRSTFVKAAHLLINAFQGIKDIKMSQSENYFNNKFNEVSKVASDAEATRQQWAILPRLIVETFSYCLILLILSMIIFFGNDMKTSVSILAVYAFAAFRIMPIVSQCISNFTSIINVTPLLEQLLKIRLETDYIDSFNEKKIKLKRSLELKNISFKYDEHNKFVLNKINYKLKKGYIYGLVGLSGSGKSTLINLMSGILYPNQGEIFLDGYKIKKKDIKFLRNFISYVGQDAYIFEGTIEENICFTNKIDEIDDKLLKESLHNAQLSDWIENKKIKKIALGERGNKISGGQRQRLSIARAFYNNADFVIFDEGTSSLDGIQESSIKNILFKLKKQSIIFMVAHKISAVQNCDEIFVLENGSITDKGSHKNLLNTNKFYKNVVMNQMINN